MSENAEAICWPEDHDEIERLQKHPTRRQIVHVRHRVGEYDVTRLILGASVPSRPSEKEN